MKPQPRRPPLPKTLPDWVLSIDDTIRRVDNPEYDRFSRIQIEVALKVKSTVAKTILRRFNARKDIGGAYSIAKVDLLRELRKVRDNPLYSTAVEREYAKKARIAALRPPPSAAVPIPFAPNEREQMERSTVAGLPAGVYLSQNTVWLTVANLPDLTKKLGALIHALDNDPTGVEKAIQ